MWTKAAVLAMFGLVLALTGCAPASAPAEPEVEPERAEAGCQHPYPCGGEWPEGLAAEFEQGEVIEVRIPGHDGTMLNGWVAFPKVPEGVRMPTVLSSSPYYDAPVTLTINRDPATQLAAPAGGANSWWDDQVPLPGDVNTHSAGFPPIRLLRKGYAMAYVSPRGTGNSEGCWDPLGPDDQLDQRAVIDWIAAQSWSNGRVGMVGLSAAAAFTWMAAVQAPKALKAIVTAGDLTDFYQWVHTAQGARSVGADYYWGQWSTDLSLLGGTMQGRPSTADRLPCEHGQYLAQETESLATGDRNADFWLTRPQSTQLERVTAAVLDTAGYRDLLAHSMQDSMVWGSLPRRTPRVQIRGWWGHNHPSPWNGVNTRLNFPSGEVEWDAYVIRWFDYWLKGIGPEPRTGVVYHQDQNLKWHEATDWSPEPSKKEVLYLAPTGLATAPGEGAVSFRSAPNPVDAAWLTQSLKSQGATVEGDEEGLNPGLCPSPVDAGLTHKYETSPLEEAVLVAGNPFAFLRLSSDQAGGIVTVSLYDLAPTFSCGASRATGARYLASGSADLNFYETPYLSHPFPTETTMEVRIDLSDITYALATGHRLALIVSNGGPYERAGSTYTPNIAIDGTSELVVPVVDGTLGGQHPHTQYPQRPFTPVGYRD